MADAKRTNEAGGNPEIMAAALVAIQLGYKVLPCKGKAPTSKIRQVQRLRKKPINKANLDFYFNDPDAEQIAILTGETVEVVDIDSKYDLTGTLKTNLLRAIEYTDPDLYEALVIEESPTGGLHLYYKCSQIGGNTGLAYRPATGEELLKGERKKVLIETRGEGGIIISAPSPGYKYKKGTIEDIREITPEQRALLHAICRSFDLIKKPELKDISSTKQVNPEAPWNVYNKDNGYQKIIDELKPRGWEVVQEDEEKVLIRRPGSAAKSSGTVWKGSNTLYLFSTSTEFESEKPYSPFGVYCQLHFEGNVKACARFLADQGIGAWGEEEGEFYKIVNDKAEIDSGAVVDWMKDIGLCKYRTSHQDFDIVQIIDKKVRIVSPDHIKKTFGDYIRSTAPVQHHNVFLNSLVRLFSREGLISQLDEIDYDGFVKSTPETGYVFYKNAVLKITKSNIELHTYDGLDGYVWEKNIIQRNYTLTDGQGDFAEFISKIAGDKPEAIQAFNCALGYILFSYKDPVNPKVIIFNDEYLDEQNESEPQGGTGKGLLIKAVAKVRNTYFADGKRFDFKKNFVFQGINPDTQLFVIEDAARGFDFEPLFSSATEGMVIEKKNKAEFIIPYELSPKILITTNYAIKGSSASHQRRRCELELVAFFSHKYRPIDHFRRRFFDDWNADEWSRFDNYMMNCLQLFLQYGLPEHKTANLEKKRLIQETNRDFYNWIESKYEKLDTLPAKVMKDEFMGKFTELYPDYHQKLSQSKFTRWLSKWCDYRKVGFDSSNSYNGRMAYSFKVKKDASDNEVYEETADEEARDANKSSWKGWSPVEEAPNFHEVTSL